MLQVGEIGTVLAMTGEDVVEVKSFIFLFIGIVMILVPLSCKFEFIRTLITIVSILGITAVI